MAYFITSDVKDEIIRPLIDRDIMTETEKEIESLARSMNVLPSNIIADTPYELKMLAMAYACSRAAFYNAGNSISNIMGSNPQDDVFTKKHKAYAEEYSRRVKSITPEILTGFATTGATRVSSIAIFRT